jgi:hypothetical protein
MTEIGVLLFGALCVICWFVERIYKQLCEINERAASIQSAIWKLQRREE